MCRDIERWEVNEVQIPGKKIEPQWLFLDTLRLDELRWALARCILGRSA